MEMPVAKRSRLEPGSGNSLGNSEEIIEEQRRVIGKKATVIENQRARIQQLEEELLRNSESSEEIIQGLRRDFKKQTLVIENQKARIQQLEEELLLRNSESSATEPNINNVLVPVPELPNEIWLEIMSYLSTFDVLRNVAQVSKKFQKLSEDQHLIRKIEVESVEFWPEDEKQKYCEDFLGVLKRSLKLRSLSFGFSLDIDNDTSGENFLEALPSMNHHLLQEINLSNMKDFLNEDILKYFEKCPLKVLKIEFKPETRNEITQIVIHPYLSWIFGFKLKNFWIFLTGHQKTKKNLNN